MASALPHFLKDPNVVNLVDLYNPVTTVDRALRDPLAVLKGRRRVRRRALVPDCDLYEAADAFLLDVKFAGIGCRDDLDLTCLDDHTLKVQERIRKFDRNGLEADQYLDPEQRTDEKFHASSSEGMNRISHAASDQTRRKCGSVWLDERRKGLMERTVRFPSAVDIDAVKAKLEHGVLRVKIPKVGASLSTLGKVRVETNE